MHAHLKPWSVQPPLTPTASIPVMGVDKAVCVCVCEMTFLACSGLTQGPISIPATAWSNTPRDRCCIFRSFKCLLCSGGLVGWGGPQIYDVQQSVQSGSLIDSIYFGSWKWELTYLPWICPPRDSGAAGSFEEDFPAPEWLWLFPSLPLFLLCLLYSDPWAVEWRISVVSHSG